MGDGALVHPSIRNAYPALSLSKGQDERDSGEGANRYFPFVLRYRSTGGARTEQH
jgi:hypothetical protein